MTPTRRPLAALLLIASSSFAQSTPQTQTLLATPTTVAWGYYSYHAKPALTVHSGDTVIMQTASTCGPPERLQSEGVPAAQIPDWLGRLYKEVPKDDRGPGGHILTGPVAVAEAQPGDVLEVRVLHISLDTDFACNGFGVGRGFLPDDFPYGRMRIIPLDRTRMLAHFAPGVEIPLHPFFGSMGIAPPESAGRYNSAPPWMHGGNMDNKELTEGSVIFFPVHAPGALFEAGDGHAGQGNGEVDITALETFLTGTFQFIVHKADPHALESTHLLWPRAETPRDYIAMGFSPDLHTATEMAIRNMIAFLATQAPATYPNFPHLTRDDAYALISVACDVDITQLVDTNDGVHVLCPKSLFTKTTSPGR
jgi:acetamidase/formamidase